MSAEEAKQEVKPEVAAPAEEAPVEEGPKETRVMSKGEKKARKALEKVGLVEVKNVTEFSLKRQGIKFVIHDPAVYKMASSEHYVVYGEPKSEFMDAKTRELLEQLQAAAQKKEEEHHHEEGEEKKEEAAVEKTEEEKKEEAKAEEAAADNDYTPNEDDINVLMGQANTTREKAIAALKKTKGDLVTAFFEFQ